MTWFIRRIAISVVLAWVVASGVFLSLHLVPGDPAEVLLTSADGVIPTPQAVAAVRRQLGLDRPLYEQYLSFFGNLLRGDLGRSLVDDYPVSGEIATRLPRTLELTVAATLLSLLIGVPAGIFAAVGVGGRFDRTALASTALLQATPVFVFSTIFILVFAQQLRWTPAGGFIALQANAGRHFVLLAMPAFAIALGFSTVIFRMTRASVLDVLSKEFVRTARAKGVAERRVLTRHVARAALTPVLTIVGMEMGTMLGGIVITESIFNWPGLSTPLLKGIEARDYPMVSGLALVIALLFLLINLITDLLYGLVDPRVRLK
jgi:peptide/nickel transport system permease protein